MAVVCCEQSRNLRISVRQIENLLSYLFFYLKICLNDEKEKKEDNATLFWIARASCIRADPH